MKGLTGAAASLWKQAFRKGFEEKYVELAVYSYNVIRSCKLPGIPWEDTRRNLLCSQMQKDKSRFGITFPIASERGVWADDYKDKGRIDICCYINKMDDQYIAFECKRFLKKDIVSSYINKKYYGEGIKRFEDNVYSESIDIGGMIAFLEEGDFENLKALMVKELPGYSVGELDELSECYHHSYIYRTTHKRRLHGPIKLTHILMDFS